MRKLYFLTTFIGLFIVSAGIAWAGEPINEIGPMEPTMFRCIDDEGDTLFEEWFDPHSATEKNTCVDDGNNINYFVDGRLFDATDSGQFNALLADYDRECDSIGGNLIPIRDTRVEGVVYEFRPTNPDNLAVTEWFGIPVKDVIVEAQGISFEIIWGTDDNGTYYFDGLGAGPVLLNLRLPPDAHMLNPNAYVASSGIDETLKVNLGYYRGDFRPQITQLVTPDGVPLSYLELFDIEELSQCGYDDLPAVIESYEPPSPLIDKETALQTIPNVGGVLPIKTSASTIGVALFFLIVLPTAGILKIRRSRS